MKSYRPTLANVGMIGSIVKIVDKLGVATTVGSQVTSPATVRRIEHHLDEENVEAQDQARLDKICVETVRDDFKHAPKAENGPRRPKRHLGRPGGGRSREELNSTISNDRPEKNSTLGSVNVEKN